MKSGLSAPLLLLLAAAACIFLFADGTLANHCERAQRLSEMSGFGPHKRCMKCLEAGDCIFEETESGAHVCKPSTPIIEKAEFCKKFETTTPHQRHHGTGTSQSFNPFVDPIQIQEDPLPQHKAVRDEENDPFSDGHVSQLPEVRLPLHKNKVQEEHPLLGSQNGENNFEQDLNSQDLNSQDLNSQGNSRESPGLTFDSQGVPLDEQPQNKDLRTFLGTKLKPCKKNLDEIIDRKSCKKCASRGCELVQQEGKTRCVKRSKKFEVSKELKTQLKEECEVKFPEEVEEVREGEEVEKKGLGSTIAGLFKKGYKRIK